jgi:hypothetical protein
MMLLQIKTMMIKRKRNLRKLIPRKRSLLHLNLPKLLLRKETLLKSELHLLQLREEVNPLPKKKAQIQM